MTAIIDKSTSAGNRGSHYNKGSEYIYFVNETSNQVWRQPINPATMIVQQNAKQISSGTALNLNSFGLADVKWVAGTTNQLQPQNGAKIKALTGYTAIDQISPDTLKNVAWDSITTTATLPENGQSTVGNFYAVRIPVSGNDPQYAKLRIFKDGSVTKAEWVAYTTSTKPWLMHTLSAEYAAPHDIVVSDYDADFYVSGGIGAAGYVVQIQRLVGGPFPQYSGYPVGISNRDANNDPNLGIPALLTPHQLVVDGALIYVVAEGGLFLLDPANGVQVQVVSGIASPIGLLLDKQATTLKAYITDASGAIYIVDITEFNAPLFDVNGEPMPITDAPIAAPAPSTALALGGPSGYLTWADETHTVFYAAVPSAAGKIKRVDLISNAVTDELSAADPTLVGPWSIEVFDEHSVTAICDAAIFDIDRGMPLSTELALGIGLIPFQFINNSIANPATPGPNDGKADTSSVPGYYFSAYHNLSFGGSLSILLNHKDAWNSGVRFYKVTMTNVGTGQSRIVNNAIVDLRWNATAVPPRFDGVTTGTQSDLFPIRNPADLWYNPYLAAIINTSLADNGHNRIKIEFFDANKQLVAGGTYTRLIFIDNTKASVTLMNIRRGTSTVPPAPGDYTLPEACGLVPYNSKDDLVEFDLTAVHPSGVGSYAISFARGGTALFSTTGSVTANATLITVKERSPGVPLRIGHLTGNCDIAGVSIALSIGSPGVINGYGWVNLGAYASRGFSLAKAPLAHTNWP